MCCVLMLVSYCFNIENNDQNVGGEWFLYICLVTSNSLSTVFCIRPEIISALFDGSEQSLSELSKFRLVS